MDNINKAITLNPNSPDLYYQRLKVKTVTNDPTRNDDATNYLNSMKGVQVAPEQMPDVSNKMHLAFLSESEEAKSIGDTARAKEFARRAKLSKDYHDYLESENDKKQETETLKTLPDYLMSEGSWFNPISLLLQPTIGTGKGIDKITQALTGKEDVYVPQDDNTEVRETRQLSGWDRFARGVAGTMEASFAGSNVVPEGEGISQLVKEGLGKIALGVMFPDLAKFNFEMNAVNAVVGAGLGMSGHSDISPEQITGVLMTPISSILSNKTVEDYIGTNPEQFSELAKEGINILDMATFMGAMGAARQAKDISSENKEWMDRVKAWDAFSNKQELTPEQANIIKNDVAHSNVSDVISSLEAYNKALKAVKIVRLQGIEKNPVSISPEEEIARKSTMQSLSDFRELAHQDGTNISQVATIEGKRYIIKAGDVNNLTDPTNVLYGLEIDPETNKPITNELRSINPKTITETNTIDFNTFRNARLMGDIDKYNADKVARDQYQAEQQAWQEQQPKQLTNQSTPEQPVTDQQPEVANQAPQSPINETAPSGESTPFTLNEPVTFNGEKGTLVYVDNQDDPDGAVMFENEDGDQK